MFFYAFRANSFGGRIFSLRRTGVRPGSSPGQAFAGKCCSRTPSSWVRSDTAVAPSPSPILSAARRRRDSEGVVGSAQRIAFPLFATALFVSALLLFAVQPMFTKMILPKLGGAPAVWSVAMVVVQAFLFIGYVYAHLIARTLTPARRPSCPSRISLAVVALTVPLGVAPAFNVPPPAARSAGARGCRSPISISVVRSRRRSKRRAPPAAA